MVSLMYELLLQGLIQQSSHNSSVLAPPPPPPFSDSHACTYGRHDIHYVPPALSAKPRVYERRKAPLARLYYNTYSTLFLLMFLPGKYLNGMLYGMPLVPSW